MNELNVYQPHAIISLACLIENTLEYEYVPELFESIIPLPDEDIPVPISFIASSEGDYTEYHQIYHFSQPRISFV